MFNRKIVTTRHLALQSTFHSFFLTIPMYCHNERHIFIPYEITTRTKVGKLLARIASVTSTVVKMYIFARFHIYQTAVRSQ